MVRFSAIDSDGPFAWYAGGIRWRGEIVTLLSAHRDLAAFSTSAGNKANRGKKLLINFPDVAALDES